MHGLMRAIGFSNINSKKELEEVLKDVAETGDIRTIIYGKSKENIIEIKKKYSSKMGIIVHGYKDENHQFVREYYFPFAEDDDVSDNDVKSVTVSRHIGKTSFAGSCDDLQMGITTIFYLQNGMDYIAHLLDGGYSGVHAPLSLVGLSSLGTILLPISKSKRQIMNQNMTNRIHKKWINEAKKGDETAIENLKMEDFDLCSQIVEKIKTEDIFTIVDNTFMPYGVECDHYMIIGEIIEVERMKNSSSGENVYYLTVNCNDMRINVVINDVDLLGEPMVGRRFRGSVWLQGILKFR